MRTVDCPLQHSLFKVLLEEQTLPARLLCLYIFQSIPHQKLKATENNTGMSPHVPSQTWCGKMHWLGLCPRQCTLPSLWHWDSEGSLMRRDSQYSLDWSANPGQGVPVRLNRLQGDRVQPPSSPGQGRSSYPPSVSLKG